MSDLPPDNDFVSESTSESGKRKNNVLWIVLGCLGCGGLGLLILGILAAIALPNFLNQANKARAMEAKVYVGSMSRGQQAHYLENQAFAASIEELQLGLSTESPNYTYTMAVQPEGTSVLIQATPIEDPLTHYVGAVFAVGETPATATTITQICESSQAIEPAMPVLNAATGTVDCPPGSTSTY